MQFLSSETEPSKSMQYKDYYRILGVSPQATDEEIRKAYKALALKFHPDKNPGNPLAEQKFKEISEAKKILTDPNLKFRYDQISRGAGSAKSEQGFAGAASAASGEVNGIFSTFFEEIFGVRKGQRRGKNYEANLSITLEEAYAGMEDVVKFEGRKVKLKIKPGIRHEQTLRIKGQGGESRSGTEAGDLYLTIKIKPHARFTRQGNDLSIDVEVSIFDLVLGNKITIPSFRGNMNIVVPPGTQSGEKLKLKGLGMPVYESFDQFGDLYANLLIRTPKRLSARERVLWEQLAEMEKKVQSR